MWPFDRFPTRQTPEPRAPGQDLAAIARRLDQLERGHEKLEHKLETLDVDWSEWFDKFRRLYARIAKRQERDEAAEAETTPQDAPGPTNGSRKVSQYSPIPSIAQPRRNY